VQLVAHAAADGAHAGRLALTQDAWRDLESCHCEERSDEAISYLAPIYQGVFVGFYITELIKHLSAYGGQTTDDNDKLTDRGPSPPSTERPCSLNFFSFWQALKNCD